MITLYNAARCPYAARARIVLAEKGIEFETVEIDLSDRPAWLYEKNPAGRVPVIEEDGGDPLPESAVIMEFIEERYPEPALLPADPAQRGLERLRIERFDKELGDDYYAYRRGDRNELEARLERFVPPVWGLAAIAYLPWILRARDMLGVELPPRVAAWVAEVRERPSVAEELAVVATM